MAEAAPPRIAPEAVAEAAPRLTPETMAEADAAANARSRQRKAAVDSGFENLRASRNVPADTKPDARTVVYTPEDGTGAFKITAKSFSHGLRGAERADNMLVGAHIGEALDASLALPERTRDARFRMAAVTLDGEPAHVLFTIVNDGGVRWEVLKGYNTKGVAAKGQIPTAPAPELGERTFTATPGTLAQLEAVWQAQFKPGIERHNARKGRVTEWTRAPAPAEAAPPRLAPSPAPAPARANPPQVSATERIDCALSDLAASKGEAGDVIAAIDRHAAALQAFENGLRSIPEAELRAMLDARPDPGKGYRSSQAEWDLHSVLNSVKDEISRRESIAAWDGRDRKGETTVDLGGGVAGVLTRVGGDGSAWFVRTPRNGLNIGAGKTKAAALANAKDNLAAFEKRQGANANARALFDEGESRPWERSAASPQQELDSSAPPRLAPEAMAEAAPPRLTPEAMAGAETAVRVSEARTTKHGLWNGASGESVNPNLAHDVEAVLNLDRGGGKVLPRGALLVFGKTDGALSLAGVPDGNIITEADIARKMRDKHGLSARDIAGLPDGWRAPVVILKDGPKFLVLTDKLGPTKSGAMKPIMVELRPSGLDGGRHNYIATAFAREGKNENKYLAIMEKPGAILYADKNKASVVALEEETMSRFKPLVDGSPAPGPKVLPVATPGIQAQAAPEVKTPAAAPAPASPEAAPAPRADPSTGGAAFASPIPRGVFDSAIAEASAAVEGIRSKAAAAKTPAGRLKALLARDAKAGDALPDAAMAEYRAVADEAAKAGLYRTAAMARARIGEMKGMPAESRAGSEGPDAAARSDAAATPEARRLFAEADGGAPALQRLGVGELVGVARQLLGGQLPGVRRILKGGAAAGLFRPGEAAAARFGMRDAGSRRAVEILSKLYQTLPEGERARIEADAARAAASETGAAAGDAFEAAKARWHAKLFEEAWHRSLKDGPQAAARTLAHEIGHLVDFLPGRSADDSALRRGNVLGHIAGLSRYMRSRLSFDPAAHFTAEREAGRETLRGEDALFPPKERAAIAKAAREAVERAKGESVEAWEARRAKAGRDAVAEEGLRRGLAGRPEVEAELRDLVAWYNTSDGCPEYYGRNAAELFAEAFSAAVNYPEIARVKAPRFMKLMDGWIEANPEAARALAEARRRAGALEAKAIRTGRSQPDEAFFGELRGVTAAQTEARRRIGEILRAEGRQTVEEANDFMRAWFVGRFEPVWKRIRRHGGWTREASAKAWGSLNRLSHWANGGDIMAYRWRSEVAPLVAKVKGGQEAFDEFLINWRVANEALGEGRTGGRVNLANPLGLTPGDFTGPGAEAGRTAAARLKSIPERDPEQWSALLAAREAFWKMRTDRESSVLQMLRRSGLMPEEVLRQLEANSAYVRFRRDVANFLLKELPGEVRPSAAFRFERGRGVVPVQTEDAHRRTLVWVENSKAKALEVPKAVADALGDDALGLGLEWALRAPGLNAALGSFLRCSNGGLRSEARILGAEERARSARAKRAAERIIAGKAGEDDWRALYEGAADPARTLKGAAKRAAAPATDPLSSALEKVPERFRADAAERHGRQ